MPHGEHACEAVSSLLYRPGDDARGAPVVDDGHEPWAAETGTTSARPPGGTSARPDPRLEEAVLAAMREAWRGGTSSASGQIHSIGIYDLAVAAAQGAWDWLQVEQALGDDRS